MNPYRYFRPKLYHQQRERPFKKTCLFLLTVHIIIALTTLLRPLIVLREWRLPSQLSRHTIALDPVFAALFANKVFIGALRRHLPLLLTRLIRRLRCYAAIQSIFRSFFAV